MDKLINIEEKIEVAFISLAKLEVRGLNSSLEYEETLKIVSDLINEEKRILKSLSSEEIIKFRKQVMKYCNKKEMSLSLGYLANSVYQRLANIFNLLSGSIAFDYATYLRYDINQIIFSFLEYLINNNLDQDVRRDLIFYKYSLIFMNYFSEDDFLQRGDSTIRIESKSFKTDFNSDLIYVDKSILILEGREHIDFILKYGDDIKDSNYYALVVISLVELIARLILSEDEILHYLQQDFNYLLEAESVALEVKNLIQEMLIILEKLKDHISVAR